MDTHAHAIDPTATARPTDVVVVGAGLAGLAAAAEVADAGKRVVLLDLRVHRHDAGSQRAIRGPTGQARRVVP